MKIENFDQLKKSVTDQNYELLDVCNVARVAKRHLADFDDATSEQVGTFLAKKIIVMSAANHGYFYFLTSLAQKIYHLIFDKKFLNDKEFAKDCLNSIHQKKPIKKELMDIVESSRLKENEEEFVGLEALKKKQFETLVLMENFDKKKQWHQYRDGSGIHYDWWSFPVKNSSRSYGKAYALTDEAVEELKKDKVFIQRLQEAAILVCRAWGWDLVGQKLNNEPGCQWTNYQVRLGKMAESLKLFDQQDLLNSLEVFTQTKNMKLNSWITKIFRT